MEAAEDVVISGTIENWRADKLVTPKVAWDACREAATRAQLKKRVSPHSSGIRTYHSSSKPGPIRASAQLGWARQTRTHRDLPGTCRSGTSRPWPNPLDGDPGLRDRRRAPHAPPARAVHAATLRGGRHRAPTRRSLLESYCAWVTGHSSAGLRPSPSVELWHSAATAIAATSAASRRSCYNSCRIGIAPSA